MIWQEWVFSVGSILFAFALFPSVVGPNKPSPGTSLLTAVVLTAYVAAFWALGQAYAATTGVITATLWWTLFWQKVGRNDTGR